LTRQREDVAVRRKGSHAGKKKQQLPSFNLAAGFNQMRHAFGAGGCGENAETIKSKMRAVNVNRRFYGSKAANENAVILTLRF
jgi:hypothetical protein